MPEKKHKSNAQWPIGTLNGHNYDISTDRHDTKEAAQAVCDMLSKNGFGGDKKVFPVMVWVS